VASVRSNAKAEQIRRGYSDVPSSRLDFVVVEDFSREHAFDEALKSTPPFEVVVHAASPFRLQAESIDRDVLKPAVLGTKRLLEAVKAHASSVTRVVGLSLMESSLKWERGIDGVLISLAVSLGHHLVFLRRRQTSRIDVSIFRC
jgi:nucleoside-diphosphate-sugar epimerase